MQNFIHSFRDKKVTQVIAKSSQLAISPLHLV